MRWLLLPVGLGIGGLAAWLLLATPDAVQPRRDSPPVGAAPGPKAAPPRERPSEAPMGEIDARSRRRLEEVLEREGIGP